MDYRGCLHLSERKNMSNTGKTEPLSDDTNKKGSILQELYLEFFAIFIPGFILVSGIVALFSLCHYCIYGETSFCDQWFKEINLSHGLFFLSIMAYAIGAILHRQRPDIPDEISALYEWCDKKKRGEVPVRAVEFSDDWKNFFAFWSRYFPSTMISRKKKFLSDKKSSFVKYLYKYLRRYFLSTMISCKKKFLSDKKSSFVKYPYKYLRRYLIEHGLSHLLYFVPWCHNCDKLDKKMIPNRFRSRTTINELKYIISCYGSKSFSSNIIHMEGNIRMFTSLWYAFKYLRRTALICLGWMLAYLLYNLFFMFLSKIVPVAIDGYETDKYFVKIFYFSEYIPILNKHFTCRFLPFLLFTYIILKAKIGIEKTIHYLRLKEIVAILHQANLLHCEFPNKSAWQQTKAKKEMFEDMIKDQEFCKNCNYRSDCFRDKKTTDQPNPLEQQIYVFNKECCLNATYSVKADSGDTHVK